MRILLINNFGTEHGGAEIMVKQLKDCLSEEGHEVRVLTVRESTSIPSFSDYTFRGFRPDSLARFFLLIFNPFAVWKLYVVLKNFRPHLVHVHNSSMASPFIFGLLKNIPTAITLHDHTSFDPTRPQDVPTLSHYKEVLANFFVTDKKSLRYYGEKIRYFWFRYFYKNVDVAIACSATYVEMAKESKLFKKVVLIHNGIPLLPFSPITRSKTLLFLGRVDKIKGVDVLLQAMPEIIRRVPKAQLIIVGDGNFKNDCKKMALVLNIDAHVHFLGQKNHKEASYFLQQTTITVVPSIWPEPFGLVVVEAMATGRPVIASRVGGIPEIVEDHKTGLLISPSDPGELAAAAIALLGDSKLCSMFARNGRLRVEAEFSSSLYIQKTLALYQNTL